MEASDSKVSVVAFDDAEITSGLRYRQKSDIARLLWKGCGMTRIGIKEIGSIYMRPDVHVTLRRNLHSCHCGVGHAERIHEAVVVERVPFLLKVLREVDRLRIQKAGVVLFLKNGIVGIICW
jgi:hypothetical protein